MNALFEQIRNIFGAIPLSQKIVMGVVILVVGFGCVGLYLYGQKTSYEPLYGNLSTDDATSIIEKLKAQNVPYQLASGGSAILVPSDQVYDLRLSLASEGIPKGGGVGFEIFDQTDFGTTEFVQKLNYQRALQGELARTIKEFSEVSDARVMIVMAEDSVFLEESKPASASVLLKLRSSLSKSKVEAVVNLVASAVKDLSPDNVTVVDSDGNVLSKKSGQDGKDSEIADEKLEYKVAYENNLAQQIQSMLERIVGSGKAIVRVSADMDFDQVNLSEETYDPDSQVVRSQQKTTENSDSAQAAANGISSVNPVVADGSADSVNNKRTEKSQKQNETVNYEISRTIKKTVNPVASVERISVAAVLDGNYKVETDKNGNQTRTYVPRTQVELDRFKQIVQNAMGYSSDREDQVTVESFPFATMNEASFGDEPGTDWPALFKRYGHLAGYAVLILAAFMFLVKPIVRTVREVADQARQAPLMVRGAQDREALPGAPESRGALPAPDMTGRQKASYLARQDLDRTTDQIRGWLSEAS